MKTNQEIKIAIIVGVIMMTVCLVLFITHKSDSNIETIDLHLYKVNQEKQVYQECRITTDQLIQLNSAIEAAYKLNDSHRVIGKKITGTYSIVSGDKTIMFDSEENKNYIFRKDTEKLYELDTPAYQIAIQACEVQQ